MADTQFDICNRALTKVGGNVIASFDDGTTEATACGQHYERSVRQHLAKHPWRFASGLASLGAPLQATPVALWKRAWQLPADLLTLFGVYRGDKPIVYDRFGLMIFTDEDADLVAEYTFRVDESRFPPYFVAGLEQDLAATLALVLRRDHALARELRQYAELVLWPAARYLDSQAQTARGVRASRLRAARLSRA